MRGHHCFVAGFAALGSSGEKRKRNRVEIRDLPRLSVNISMSLLEGRDFVYVEGLGYQFVK